MILVESSAVVSIYKAEPGHERFVSIVESAPVLGIAGSNYLEIVIVLARFAGSRQWLDQLIARQGIKIVTIGERETCLAADAFERYGKGRGHPAQLNFGDCLSYAVAKSLDAPLLYAGNDFGHTDITAA